MGKDCRNTGIFVCKPRYKISSALAFSYTDWECEVLQLPICVILVFYFLYTSEC